MKALLAKGEEVKAASRSGHPIEGAEGVVFDFADAATIAPAFEGVGRVYIMLPSGYVNARELLLPVVAAAAAVGAKIVFQSVLGVDADDDIPYRQVEIAVEKSGVPFVILRPNWFSDNFHTFWKAGIEHGVIAVPAGEGKSSFIDARDIAESAVAALGSSAFDGKAYDLTGPRAYSYAEAAKLISGAIDRPVSYQSLDDAAFIAMLTRAGVARDYASFLASIFHPVRGGWTAAVTDNVETLTGKAPRSLEDYVRDHAARLAA